MLALAQHRPPDARALTVKLNDTTLRRARLRCHDRFSLLRITAEENHKNPYQIGRAARGRAALPANPGTSVTWQSRSSPCKRSRRRSGKAPTAWQGAKANRSKSARHEHANARAQAGCPGNNIRGGRRPVPVQSGAPVSQGSGHVPFPDRLAVGLRAIALFQPCFQTLDRTFAVRGPQEEGASCGCIRPDSGSDHRDGCPTQFGSRMQKIGTLGQARSARYRLPYFLVCQ
jgi:hypothetical protein